MIFRLIYDDVTRAKQAGTLTINVHKQCGMISRYARKQDWDLATQGLRQFYIPVQN